MITLLSLCGRDSLSRQHVGMGMLRFDNATLATRLPRQQRGQFGEGAGASAHPLCSLFQALSGPGSPRQQPGS